MYLYVFNLLIIILKSLTVVYKINIGTSMTFKNVINGFSKNKNKLNFIVIK